MGLRMLTNPNMLEVRLRQIGDRAEKGMATIMHRHAVRIRDLAREYAPVKTGLLENSIDYSVVKDGRRKGFVVFIDLDAVKQTGKNGRVVELGEYAFIMEERLRPFGRGGPALNLGPGSRYKAASGRKVGGRFLSRAITQGSVDILGDVAKEIRRVTNSTSSVGVKFQRNTGGTE
jgi:hypothetical protein